MLSCVCKKNGRGISPSDDINLVGENINTIKKNSKISFVICVETG